MIEFRPWIKGGLFLSSYIPFYLIMALMNWSAVIDLSFIQFHAGLFFVLLTIVSGLILAISIRFRKGREPSRTHIGTVNRKNELLTGYLVTYLFPFLNMDLEVVQNWVALMLFFLVLGIIQYRSSQLHVNPVLTAFGYDIYEIEEADTGDILLLIAPKSEVVRGSGDVYTVKMGPETRLAISP